MTPTAGYTEMKDSGIPWIGEIPKSWDIVRGKNIIALLERPVNSSDDVITCFRDGEVTLRKNRREEGFTNSLKEIGYQGVNPGDLVVHGMDGFAGSIGISDSRGKASPVLNVLDSTQNKRYLMYYLRGMAYKDVFMALSTGIRVRSCDLRWNKLSVFPFLLPSLSEQSAIAAYLDAQCAKIDEIIAEAKASIEDYKQWKASIIYEAVTKGLDPNVEMKDSGIEWVGEIPMDWKPMRFKFVATVKANLVNPKDYPKLLQVAPDNVVKDTGTLLPCNTVAESGVISWNHLFYKGQLLYSKIRPTLNKVVVAPFDGLCSADMYPIETTQNIKFMLYVMLSEYFVQQVALCTADRVKMPKINQEELGNITVIIPSISKQKQIVDYLDSRCNFFDMLIKEKKTLISDLEAYKKSLIYEVVTGKRRVC